MSRETKQLAFTNIKAKASGRRRVGIAAVFGNVDEIGDRIIPGAFAKTISEGAPRCKHLWNHSWQHPPIASIKELRELTRAELPLEVLQKSPEATGGLLVDRDYYKGIELADWILNAIDADDITEMSFAYDTIQSTTVTEPLPGDPEKTRNVRELRELKLYDTSDVLYGCNSATIAAGAKGLIMMPLAAIASQLVLLQDEIKAGRRNSDSDQKLIDLIHSSAVTLGAVCDTGSSSDDDDPEKGKAAAAESTALSPDNWFAHAGIQLANLEN